MAPIVFNRTKPERRPRRIITSDLSKLPDEDDDGLSPLEMERKKFVVCKMVADNFSKAQEDDADGGDGERVTTPETLDSAVMTFSDDDDDDDLQFGDADNQFDEKWWEPTPVKNNTLSKSNKMSAMTMTPFSKLALENRSKRLALSPLDTNKTIQFDVKPINMNKKDTSRRELGTLRKENEELKTKLTSVDKCASRSPFNFSKYKSASAQATMEENKNPMVKTAEIMAELDTLWKNTKASRQPYVSPFSKYSLERNAGGKHTMPPAYSKSYKDKSQWVQFTPVKGFNKKKRLSQHRSLNSRIGERGSMLSPNLDSGAFLTPAKHRNNRRGSPKLSPLHSSAYLTPAKEDPLFDLSIEAEEEGVVEIKIRRKSEEDNDDYSVVSGLTKIDEVVDEGLDDLIGGTRSHLRQFERGCLHMADGSKAGAPAG